MADWPMDQAAIAGPVQTEDTVVPEGDSFQQDTGRLDDCAVIDDFCEPDIIFIQEVGTVS